MNYVLFGTPRFAEIVLKGLIEGGMPPLAVVCNPDRPIGRKQVVTAPPVKQLILTSGLDIEICQPELLDENFVRQLKIIDADFFVVAAYAKIIPEIILSIPRVGVLGTHPSLLPLYRGASPIQSVILAGETQTGVTIYKMDAKMDHGPILAQRTIPLDALATSYPVLESQLAELSADLLLEIMPKFVDGTANIIEQDHSKTTFTKKFTTEDAFIDPTMLDEAIKGNTSKAQEVLRAINALNPEPGTWTRNQTGKRMKLLQATIINGALKLSKIQIEGETSKQL